MKKLISLLLAVSLMAASAVASAAGLGAAGQRNPGSWSNVTGGRNSGALRDYRTDNQLACYRPGDTITFTINQNNIDIGQVGQAGYVDNSFKAGDVITFISSIDDDNAELDSSTVMFIDQVVADNASSVSYSYKIREGLAEGRYKMDIKIGDVPVDTYYYGVADPKVEIIYVDEDETVQAYKSGDLTYYFASATIGTGMIMYEQVGVAEYGFDFGNDNVFTFDAAVFDDANDTQEIEGTVNWFFALPVAGIEDVATAPIADGVIIDE